MSPSRKKSIWLGPVLERFLASHSKGNTSGTLNTAIERYQTICQHHMPRLRWREWCAIFDALNGCWLNDAWSPRYAFAEVHDSPGLGEKWEVDQAVLVARMQAMTYVESVAVVDAAERFWTSDVQPGDAGWRPVVEGIVGKEHIEED